MTIENAQINLGSNVFATGQAYVALSRVTSLKGIKLTHFDSECVKTDTKVVRYYRELDISQNHIIKPKKPFPDKNDLQKTLDFFVKSNGTAVGVSKNNKREASDQNQQTKKSKTETF